ncbi:hypothetical protein HAX54_019972 [Datura stramonium]|uniref:Glutamine amidotransferase type-2 domain-containing protein n=1 Tax=Datura stramonium TaxID=4076 RepID=A0ABS8URR6_DATST|nr:hypothetical protein [Datura stramonium]
MAANVSSAAATSNLLDCRLMCSPCRTTPSYKNLPYRQKQCLLISSSNQKKPRPLAARQAQGRVGDRTATQKPRASAIYTHALQHRGQEGASMVSVHTKALKSVTGIGLVSHVFNESELDQLPGDMAIGHVSLSLQVVNLDPLVLAHNGNFVNYQLLRAKLEEKGSIFRTTSDTEVVLHLIAKSKAKLFVLRILEACEKLQGAYSMVFATEDGKLVAVRDPLGSAIGYGTFIEPSQKIRDFAVKLFPPVKAVLKGKSGKYPLYPTVAMDKSRDDRMKSTAAAN